MSEPREIRDVFPVLLAIIRSLNALEWLIRSGRNPALSDEEREGAELAVDAKLDEAMREMSALVERYIRANA